MNRLAVYLNRHLDGVVYSSPSILSAHANDRSPLSYYPRLVATPVHSLDVQRLVKFSSQLAKKNISLPISVRGAGLDKCGADLGSGLIISTAKLNRIQEIDTVQRLVRVQVGVTLGELRGALVLHGLDFPVIGDSRETIGDLISRRASAYKDARPACIEDFISSAEVVFSDASIAEVKAIPRKKLHFLAKEKGFEAHVHTQLAELYRQNSEVISNIDALHDRSGYAGIASYAKQRKLNLVPLFCGAENSLGIVTEVILRVEAIYDAPNRVAVVCRNSHEYCRAVKVLKQLNFNDLFVYDTELFNEVEHTGKASRFFRKASDDGYMIVASAKDDATWRRRRKISRLKSEIGRQLRIIEEDKSNSIDFERLSENLDAYLNDSSRDNYRAPLIDGVYVPAATQLDFLNGVIKLSDRYNCRLAVYGYPDFDSFTLRPNLSTNDSEGRRKLISFMRDYLALIHACGGNPCGEAAEGRWLPVFSRRYSEVERLQLDAKIKQIFDPQDILTSGIKQEASAQQVLRHFRTDHNNEIIAID